MCGIWITAKHYSAVCASECLSPEEHFLHSQTPFTFCSSPDYYIYKPSHLINESRDVALLLIKFYIQLTIQAAAWT